MELKIWDWNYEPYIQGMLLLGFSGIVVGLLFTRSTKQHELKHLLAGVALILFGSAMWLLMKSGEALIGTLESAKYISGEGASVAAQYLVVMRFVIPTVAIALGTRFIGNWVVSESPDKEQD